MSDPILFIDRSGGSFTIDANVIINGNLLVNGAGSLSRPIVDVRELYNKSPGNYYIKFLDDSISQHYWDGMWLKVHDEGLNAQNFTSYWSDTTTQQMSNFGNLGSGYGHGWNVNTGKQNTLTIPNLPVHSFARYSVKWHFVDSIDNEANSLRVYDYFSYNNYEQMWYGSRSLSNSGMGVNNNYHNTTSSFTAATYSYEPWNGSGTTTMGYASIDTNTMPHTLPRFKVLHYTETNQAISDEAVYYTHATLYIR
jgi:hypothetical protein